MAPRGASLWIYSSIRVQSGDPTGSECIIQQFPVEPGNQIVISLIMSLSYIGSTPE